MILFISNFVPGLPNDESARCSDLTGILGTLYSVEILTTHFCITSGTITIVLDGKSSLDKARDNWSLQIHQLHFDLLHVVSVLVKPFPIALRWKWLRGHQREKGVQNLD